MADPINKLNELQGERASHVARMREILDLADAEGRDLNAEERSEYDRLETDVDTKAARIKSEIKLREQELELETRGAFDPRDALGADRDDEIAERSEAYAKAFNKYLRKDVFELDGDERKILTTGALRDQQTGGKSGLGYGSGSSGGYLVPIDFQKALVMHAVQAGTMRRTNVSVIVTGTGENLLVPKTTVHGAASWLSEGTPATSADETFGQVTLGAYMIARLVKVSVQLVEDNAVDLEGYLAKEIGRSIGAEENNQYLNGNGTTQPTGLISQASLGTTGAAGQTASITADDLIELFYSVGPQYRTSASFMMADSTLKAVRKLKDSTGNYLFAVTPGVGGSLRETPPDTLIGKPIFDDPNVPVMGVSAKSVLFGDFSAYYIRDVGQAGPEASEKPMGAFAVRRLDERFMDALTVGFIGYHRTDGNLVDQTGAIKYYQNAAS